MIEVEHLRKEYGNLVAVRNLSLTLDEGDIFGFIGPNGAGKTTTLKMLATLLLPTAGRARIGGLDITREPEKVRAIIGYMPDSFGVYDDIKVWEYLDFFAAAYKIPHHRRQRIVDDVLELTDLTGKKDVYVESLSRGMRQRLCLAKTLVHDPKVLLLDEPASGLDPRARVEIKELLRELKRMGKTIMVSSHILPELADLCNKIGIIEQGDLIVSGDVQAIVAQVRGGRALQLRAPEAEVPRVLELLAERSDVAGAEAAAGEVRLQFTGTETEPADLLRDLVLAGVRVQAFGEQETDLEDVFMKVTRGIVS
ncbi:MAG: ABC transporter ATP-binding protein [Armatimonadetes bacterium]|nr:ABC transporter ATP-binding protein [Armatimonadota bacterium]